MDSKDVCGTLECYSKPVAMSTVSGDPVCLKCSLALVERFGSHAVHSIEGAKFPWDYPATIKCHGCGIEFNEYMIGMTGDCPSCRKPLPREMLNE